MVCEIANSAGALQLSEVLNLSAAAPLAGALSERRGGNVVIDASQVRYLGMQCLQVLLSAAATWSAEGCQLRVANRSEGFVMGLQLVGIPATAFAE
jgi:chemotaxis protein CheX